MHLVQKHARLLPLVALEDLHLQALTGLETTKRRAVPPVEQGEWVNLFQVETLPQGEVAKRAKQEKSPDLKQSLLEKLLKK
jgi:hypothetical protein